MASFPFFFFLTLSLSISFSLSSTVVEDLANLQPPPDFNSTITTNCLHNPSLRYCNSSSSSLDINEIFRSTIVASHLCNESKNPNCVESFPKINLHGRPKRAALYLSFAFFWKYCPLSVITIDLSKNSLKGGFPTDVLLCTQIRSLDLSHNNLSGDVPLQAFSALTNLTHLNLSYNRFLESKISDTEFFTRFNASSFIRSGLLPNAQHYKIKFLVLLVGFPVMMLLFFCCFGWLCFERPDYLPTMFRRGHKFTPMMLDAATDGFSKKNLVTKGKTIEIYKGTLRDGRETRIEVYKNEVSREQRQKFAEECKILAQLRHKNLVRVLGWCDSRGMRALVTEWTVGETTETWLNNNSPSAPSWNMRLEVVIGVVEGMCYLRQNWPEVSYDLSTSSVLLSDDGEPMISRFKFSDGSNSTNIYEFGLFLLEMITNLRPDEEQEGSKVGYVQYLRVHYPENLERVIDDRMKLSERTVEQAKQGICLGLMCTDQPPAKQPSLRQISNMLASFYRVLFETSRHN